MRTALAFALSLFLTSAASAQSYIYQSGNVTPNHAVRFITNGVVGDGGTAANGFLSSIGVLAQGPAICQQSAAPPSPYNQLCLGVNTAGAATISLQNYGGATAQNLNFVINGVTYPFPQSLNSLVIGGTAIINCSTNGYGFYNNNGILGCEPNTASPGGSNTDLQYNSSGSFGGISGATSDGTNLTVGATNLRVLGSSTGYNTLETANAGASNYVTTFPAATDTVVELAQTQTLTNKTIASSTDVLGGVTLTLGSDATGDIYYRNSGGVLTRLGIGSTGNVLTVSGGLPAWESNTGNFVTTFSAGTTGFTPNSATSGAITLAGTLVVANGGTNCSAASITCFNNITGFSAAGTTGTTSTNLVFSTSPTLVTPTLGVATATSLNGLTVTSGTGTLTIANAKTLTDTSGIGADLLLGATGGGFAAYGGASCTNQFITAISATGAGTCASVVNADLTAGTFTNITGTGTLTAGATGSGFTVALGSSTITGQLAIANGGTNANLTANAGGVVYSTSSALAILNNPNSNGECLLSGTSAPTWGSCSGSTGVASLGNASADTSLTIAGTGSGPWTGTVTAALNLGNTNTWTGPQTMSGSSGYWGCSGNNGSPSFSNGVGSVQCAAIDGLILRGQGSTYDIDIHNSGNSRVAAVPTGTQNFQILGGVFVGTSGTFGTQQTTQGSLVLANTAAGAYATTLQSSNSASASATYTLPTAPPAGNGYSLTASTAGVMSWTNVGGGGGTPCTTTASSIQYDAAGSFGCVAGVTSNGTAMTFANGDLLLSGSSSGAMTLEAPAAASTYVMTFPAATDTVDVLGTAQTFTAAKTFTNSDIKLLGSSTGATTFTSGNSSGTNYTWTVPASTDTFAGLTVADQTLSGGANVTAYQATISGSALTVDCGKGPLQYVFNTGAFTLTAPTSDGSCVLEVINASGSSSNPNGGAITPANFSPLSISGATFANTLTQSAISCTVTSASPGVITWTAHGLTANAPIYLTGTTAPTGLTKDVVYYVVGSAITTNTIEISATPGGAAINTSSTGTSVTCNEPSVYDLSITSINNQVLGIWTQVQ